MNNMNEPTNTLNCLTELVADREINYIIPSYTLRWFPLRSSIKLLYTDIRTEDKIKDFDILFLKLTLLSN